jgi:hypothetical protein
MTDGVQVQQYSAALRVDLIFSNSLSSNSARLITVRLGIFSFIKNAWQASLKAMTYK